MLITFNGNWYVSGIITYCLNKLDPNDIFNKLQQIWPKVSNFDRKSPFDYHIPTFFCKTYKKQKTGWFFFGSQKIVC